MSEKLTEKDESRANYPERMYFLIFIMVVIVVNISMVVIRVVTYTNTYGSPPMPIWPSPPPVEIHPNRIIEIILAFIGLIIASVLLDEAFDVLNGELRASSVLAFCGSSVCGIMSQLAVLVATMQIILLIVGSLLITTAWIMAKGGLERLVYFALNSLDSLFVWLDQFRKKEGAG